MQDRTMINARRPLRILITGGCAPPYGGVSVYVRRVLESMTMRGHDCHVYDQYFAGDGKPPQIHSVNGKWGLYWRIIRSESFDIMHINEYTWKQRCALVTLARFKGMRSVITLHSFREDYAAMSMLKRIAMYLTLKQVDYLISSGKNELEQVKEITPASNIRVITPFIPPFVTDSEDDLPDAIRAFCERHTYTICGNGSSLDFYQGEEIYGLDMLVEACSLLRNQWDAGVVYCLSVVSNIEYLGRIQDRIRQLGIEEHFLIYTGSVEFWKVIRQCDLFIRPSRTDSFGISVAESVFLGTPAIASDVCPRPAGTLVFPAGNLEKMLELVSSLLNKMDGGALRENYSLPDNGADLLEQFYYEIAGELP